MKLTTNYQNHFNKYDNVSDILESNFKVFKHKKKEYVNLPCSFDIETSSFYYSDVAKMTSKEKIDDSYQKRACMYMFGIGINGKVYIGRDYFDFNNALDDIAQFYKLEFGIRHLIIYVHNLAYEMQFIRKHLKINSMFAIKEREPIYFVDERGIEFRCSYLLSGYKLEKVGEHLLNYKVNKLVGDLDYDKIRHPKSEISDIEYSYLVNDNLVVMSYIREYMDKLGGNITRIPFTKTGVVRKLCRDNCFYEQGNHHTKSYDKYLKFQRYVHAMNIQSVSEYEQMHRAFSGGFTHANAFNVGKVFRAKDGDSVASFDFCSSYPYCLCAFEYPVSSGKLVKLESKEQLEEYLRDYCCIFDIEVFDLESKISFEHYLSESKCEIDGQDIIDNGRVVYAKHLYTTITNVDYSIIRNVYNWSKIRFRNFRIYKKAYLPKDLILTILTLYHDKTALKGVDGKEIEYMSAKENINSVY